MVVASLVVIFIVASLALFVWPPTGRPEQVDAVVSMNGMDEVNRTDKAVSLVEHGYAHVLLFSQGTDYSTPCPRVPGVRVVCFEPIPGRTVGEAEWVARYANAHHWRRLILVSGHAQTLRAELLLHRCYSGEIITVPAHQIRSELVHDVIYEWGAMARALLVDRHC